MRVDSAHLFICGHNRKAQRPLCAPLFERLHRHIELTPLGEAILGKAKALVEDAAALPDVFDQARAGVRGPAAGGLDSRTVLPYYLAHQSCGDFWINTRTWICMCAKAGRRNLWSRCLKG